MVNIILLDTKESDRMPGKNDLLWQYTTSYLENDTVACDSNTSVIVLYTSETEHSREKWPWNTGNVNAIEAEAGTLNTTTDCISWLYENDSIKEGDTNVLLQLTQPVRRKNLIADSISELDNCNLVKSYCEWYNCDWRDLDNVEKIKQYDDVRKYYDGAIYTWKGKMDWVGKGDTENKAHYIKNYTGPVVDIDYPDQYNKEYINGVQKLADQ